MKTTLKDDLSGMEYEREVNMDTMERTFTLRMSDKMYSEVAMSITGDDSLLAGHLWNSKNIADHMLFLEFMTRRIMAHTGLYGKPDETQ